MNKYIFILQVPGDAGCDETYFIGQVEYRGDYQEEGAAGELQNYWNQWREEVPQPGADSDFVPWLIENSKNWHESNIPVAVHTFQ
jgi:hypothetical protein